MTRPTTTTEVCHVDNLHDPTRPWCLRWRTAVMPGPACWYFATEAEAREAAERLVTPRRPRAARCGDTATDTNHTYTCRLPAGHAGTHVDTRHPLHPTWPAV